MEVLARPQGIAQLLRGRAQPTAGQRGDRLRVGGALGHGVQHPLRTDAQQVRDEAGHLDVGFFEQGFQPIPLLDAGPCQFTWSASGCATSAAPDPVLQAGSRAIDAPSTARATPKYSRNTHAPGQTTYRPQPLHGECDLTTPGRT